MKKTILLITIFSACLKPAFSQSIQPDVSFGVKGIVKADIGSHYNYELLGKQILLQSDADIYVILQTSGQTLISKRHSNGSINTAYSNDGYSDLATIAPSCAAMQPDKKIIVAGQKWNGIATEYDLVRYNTDGSIDNTFGDKGIKTVSLAITSLAIQTDGKIVVAGSVSENENSYFGVARYNADGSTDNSFSNDGKVSTNFGFSTEDGIPEYDVPTAVAIQDDGKIVVTGSIYNYSNLSKEMAIARYQSDGSLDKTFDSDGKQTVNFGAFENYGYSLAFQTDGKIIVAGNANPDGSTFDFAVARLSTNGKLDKTFNGNGKQIQKISAADLYPNAVALQQDGKIVVAGVSNNGRNNDFAVARFNTNGSKDKTFATTGNLKTDFGSSDDYANSLAIQPDGKILVEGYAYTYSSGATKTVFVIARYNPNGGLDNTFDHDGKLTGVLQQGFTIYNSVAVQANGKVVVAGYAWNGSNNDFAVARYNTNGTLDNTFGSDGKGTTNFGANDYANSLAIQSDGKIVVAGYSSSSSGSSFAIARYNTDGSLDSTFSGDGKQTTTFGSSDNFANSIAIQTDGKIVVAGYSNNGFGNNNNIAVARYTKNGALDNSFNGHGKQTTDINSSDDYGYSVALQTDGKIVVAGRSWNGTNNDFAVVRYTSNGSLDNTFDGDGRQTTDFGSSDDYACAVTLQGDGKIVVAGHNGDYTMYKIAMARYNANGKLDATFGTNGTLATDFGLSDASANSLAILPNGKIIIGGSSNNHFSLALFNSNGTADNSFSKIGMRVAAVSAVEDKIESIVVANNKLYAAGYGTYPATLGVVTRYLINENKAPTVSITSPADNAGFAAPATITIKAVATDVDGKIHSVKFYNGKTYLKAVFASPYTYTFSNLPAGLYSITAKATDDKGAETISAPVKISVKGPNKAPIVSIANPTNNVAYTAPANVSINATASDVDGSIYSVKFYNGTTYLKTVFAKPYTYVLSNLAPGTYSITAKATDNLGAQTVSAPIAVTVSGKAEAAREINKLDGVNADVNGGVSLRLSPNPTTSTLNICTIGLQQYKQSTISIISASGALMKNIQPGGSVNTVQVDVSNLVSGIYTVRIVCGDKMIYKQFVKM